MGAGKRLTKYIEKQGFTKKDFCNTFGFEYNSFVQILAEKRPLGIKIIDKVHEALPLLNIHWMLYGEGTTEINSENLLTLNEEVESYAKTDVFEKTLLRYLEHEAIIDKINEIAKKRENPEKPRA